ncbi:hypothetical protein ACJJH9_19340 [Microbulbifer sp. DLAB2-AF]|uniref:hypothetical protein n=1 Tax=Microbulbifer sp. DLAB2-AF TaxID=3243395 RepID=UPI00403A3A15
MNNIKILVFVMLIFNASFEVWASTNKPIKSLYNQINQIYKDTRMDPSGNKLPKKFYSDNFSPIINSEALSDFSGIELEYLFQATKTAIAYDPDVNYAKDMARVLHYLKIKNLVKERHLVALQEAYIATRQFELASNMVEQKSSGYLQVIPEVHRVSEKTSRHPTIWKVEKNSIKQSAFSIPDNGPFILVASNPLCSFSISAAQHIIVDEELLEIFSEYSYWLTEPRGKLYIEGFLDWSRNYPSLPTGLMHETPPWSELPELRSNIGTPAFYFFSDGKFIEYFVGWPREGEPEALNNALRNVGLNRSEKQISVMNRGG